MATAIDIKPIKDRPSTYMRGNEIDPEIEDRLTREIQGTAEYILQMNGFRWYTSICQEFRIGGLHFRDLAGVSPEAIDDSSLRPIEKKRMKDLCAHCRDENTYRRWRRGKIQAAEKHTAAFAQQEAERRENWLRNAHELRILLAQLQSLSRVEAGGAF